jgi:hypothetical protein
MEQEEFKQLEKDVEQKLQRLASFNIGIGPADAAAMTLDSLIDVLVETGVVDKDHFIQARLVKLNGLLDDALAQMAKPKLVLPGV